MVRFFGVWGDTLSFAEVDVLCRTCVRRGCLKKQIYIYIYVYLYAPPGIALRRGAWSTRPGRGYGLVVLHTSAGRNQLGAFGCFGVRLVFLFFPAPDCSNFGDWVHGFGLEAPAVSSIPVVTAVAPMPDTLGLNCVDCSLHCCSCIFRDCPLFLG